MPTSLPNEPVTKPARYPVSHQFDVANRRWVMAQPQDDQFVQVPPLDGRFLTDQQSIGQAAEDFGQLIHRLPLAILQPASVEDVVKMVQFANQYAIRVIGRGNGHTAFGQAQTEAGLVIDLRSLHQIHQIDADRVMVDTGVNWRDLLQQTIAVGLTPPVLTDYTELTVGGTLSVGGVSGRSFRYGAQVDQVLELEVVTGKGERLICSTQRRADLFYGVLA